MSTVLFKEERLQTDTGRPRVTAEAELTAPQLQARECQKPEEASKHSPLGPSVRTKPCNTQTSDVGPPSGEKIHFCCFKLPRLQYLVVTAPTLTH